MGPNVTGVTNRANTPTYSTCAHQALLTEGAAVPLWLLIVIEVLCVGVLVAGLVMIYVPAALILAGIAGVLVCERWSPVLMARKAAKERVAPTVRAA